MSERVWKGGFMVNLSLRYTFAPKVVFETFELYIYILYIYMSIGVWGKGVLNGKCSARGPRKMSEAVAD